MCRIILMLVLLYAFNVDAQTLSFSLSAHKGHHLVLVARQGVNTDTLAVLLLDSAGKGSYSYGTRLSRPCIAAIGIKEDGLVSYEMVLSPAEHAVLSDTGQYLSPLSTRISGSPENAALDRWYGGWQQLKQKQGLAGNLLQLYNKKDKQYSMLAQIVADAAAQQHLLEDTIARSSFFAARYIQFRIAEEQELAAIWAGDSLRRIARNYFVNKIDFETLYSTGHWFPVINSCIEAYVKYGPYYEQYGTDIVGILKKIKDPDVFSALADAAITITERLSWGKDQEAVLGYIIGNDLLRPVSPKLKKLVDFAAMNTGSAAPDIVITKHTGNIGDHQHTTTLLKAAEAGSKYTLLVFYQSGCGPCETTLTMLRANYDSLRQKSMRLVSVSADTDSLVFSNTAASFPWPDKYCDYEGTDGINFRNYAVLGTPTLYIIGSGGKILAKLATIEELLAWIKERDTQ